AGTTVTPAIRNTTRSQARVRGAPAASAIVSEPGNRNGYWATPQPASSATTAAAASTRVPQVARRTSRTIVATPQSPEMMTSGSPSRTRPWNTIGASPRRTNRPATAMSPVATPLPIARRQKRRARHRQHADQDRRRAEPRAAGNPSRGDGAEARAQEERRHDRRQRE